MTIKPRKLKGFRDIFGGEMVLRSKILQILSEAAEQYGFQLTDTPAMEYTEMLLGAGGETDKQVYTFTDQGGRNVSLRYDLTVPLARFAAEHQGAYHLPFKRFQMGKVWRAEKPQKGRYREFLQADFDILGPEAPHSEIEILMLVASCLSRCPGPGYVMQLGHREVLSALCKVLLQIEGSHQNKVFIILDKLAKVGKDAVAVMLEEHLSEQRGDAGGAARDAENFAKIISSASPEEIKDYLKGSPGALKAFEELEFYQQVLSSSFPKDRIRFEITTSLARGLDYYTGLVFETTCTDATAGSVCSGGRYSGLLDRFTRNSISAVGASVGVDRLVSILHPLVPSHHPILRPNSPRFFLVSDLKHQEAFGHLVSSALLLRRKGVSVIYALSVRSIQKQYQQASRTGAQYAVFLELENSATASDPWAQPVTIKNLDTSKEDSGILKDLLRLHSS